MQTLEAQVSQFTQTGFVVIPDALPPDQVNRLAAAVDRIFLENGADKDLQLFGLPDRDPEFLEVLDVPSVLPLVAALLNSNTYLYHSHLDVNPPLPTESDFAYNWHMDMKSVTLGLPAPCPRLSVKVAYFLTDTTSPDRGNLHLIPDSHQGRRAELPTDPTRKPEDALPVLAPRGSAVLMDPRVWHARGPNRSQVTRKVLFLAYAYRWIRPRDELAVPAEEWATLSPVRRQLLGQGTSLNAFHLPTPEDVPLRAHLAALENG